MERVHQNLVDATFGPRAKAYVDSAVHSKGADLDALEGIVSALKPARAIDVGCGGGHVAYLLARHAGSVTAAGGSARGSSSAAACTMSHSTMPPPTLNELGLIRSGTR